MSRDDVLFEVTVGGLMVGGIIAIVFAGLYALWLNTKTLSEL